MKIIILSVLFLHKFFRPFFMAFSMSMFMEYEESMNAAVMDDSEHVISCGDEDELEPSKQEKYAYNSTFMDMREDDVSFQHGHITNVLRSVRPIIIW